jgi:hypothetical protein
MLQDIAKNNKLFEIGVTKICFDITEINNLTENLKPLLQNKPSSEKYQISLFNDGISKRKRIDDLIFSFMEKNAPYLLTTHTILLTNLIIKPTKFGVFPLHQNWTFVDESKTRSYTLWIPLVKTTPQNGTLQFILGSHNIFNDEKRGYNTPYFFMKHEERLKRHLVPFYLELGEALLFDDAIMHFSDNNLSDSNRVAIQITLVLKNEPIVHYCFKKGLFFNKILEYEVDKTFYDSLKFENYKLKNKNTHHKRQIKFKEWKKLSDIYNNFTNNEAHI